MVKLTRSLFFDSQTEENDQTSRDSVHHERATVPGCAIAPVRATRVHARVVNTRILCEVDLLTCVVHVSRGAEATRAHNSTVNASRFHAEGCVVYVVTALWVDVGAVPRLRAVFVLGAVALITV
jgi:hypothetical protein